MADPPEGPWLRYFQPLTAVGTGVWREQMGPESNGPSEPICKEVWTHGDNLRLDTPVPDVEQCKQMGLVVRCVTTEENKRSTTQFLQILGWCDRAGRSTFFCRTFESMDAQFRSVIRIFLDSGPLEPKREVFVSNPILMRDCMSYNLRGGYKDFTGDRPFMVLYRPRLC